MYQSNEAKIKKEIPSLLLGRGQGPRPASSLPCVNSTRGYRSAAGTVASPSLPLKPSSHVTNLLKHLLCTYPTNQRCSKFVYWISL